MEGMTSSPWTWTVSRILPDVHNRSNWATGPWNNEPDLVLWDRHLTTYRVHYLTERGPTGCWNGYISVPSSLATVPTEVLKNLQVHGGVCFGPATKNLSCYHLGGYEHLDWVGFDCAHSEDAAPGLSFYRYGRYRTLEFAYYQCEVMAAQLAYQGYIPGWVGEILVEPKVTRQMYRL